jgi:RNA polymerase sigma factor (sigma-70 family)
MTDPSADQGTSTRRDDLFQPTDWSVVQLAGQGPSAPAAEALEKLCRAYWFPLYAFIRRRGYPPHEAQDLTQEFLLRLMEKHYFANAAPERGKFRSFLLTALNHFLANDRRRSHAAKRGGGQEIISLDQGVAEAGYSIEPVSHLTPEKLFERRWALTLLDRALARLREEFVTSGKTTQFNQLRGFLTAEAEGNDYGSVARRLGMTTGAVAVAIHRLRHRYGDLVREEIARTVSTASEVEEEIRWLFATVA